MALVNKNVVDACVSLRCGGEVWGYYERDDTTGAEVTMPWFKNVEHLIWYLCVHAPLSSVIPYGYRWPNTSASKASTCHSTTTFGTIFDSSLSATLKSSSYGMDLLEASKSCDVSSEQVIPRIQQCFEESPHEDDVFLIGDGDESVFINRFLVDSDGVVCVRLAVDCFWFLHCSRLFLNVSSSSSSNKGKSTSAAATKTTSTFNMASVASKIIAKCATSYASFATQHADAVNLSTTLFCAWLTCAYFCFCLNMQRAVASEENSLFAFANTKLEGKSRQVFCAYIQHLSSRTGDHGCAADPHWFVALFDMRRRFETFTRSLGDASAESLECRFHAVMAVFVKSVAIQRSRS